MINFADNFCSFEQSKSLKKIGFDGKVGAVHGKPPLFIDRKIVANHSIAILRSQALAFFREKFGLEVSIERQKTTAIVKYFASIVEFDVEITLDNSVFYVDTYAEAENA